MAKQNQVTLCGIVKKEPLINGNKYGTFIMTSLKGNRNAGNGAGLKYTYPIVISHDPEVIKTYNDISKNDLVLIKGVITTSKVTKISTCDCGAENEVEGSVISIEPIYIEIIKKNIKDEEIPKIMEEHQEISNDIRVIGNVCTDIIDGKTKTKSARYQIAIPRTYRIYNSKLNEDKDYPWVRSYAENATEDAKRIYPGSTVLIDGYIQALRIKRECTCLKCNKKYQWTDSFMEIVPYEIEYLKNYNTDEKLGIVHVKEEIQPMSEDLETFA